MACLHLWLLWVALSLTTVSGQSCDISLTATFKLTNHTALVGSSGKCTWTITSQNDTVHGKLQSHFGDAKFTVEVIFSEVSLANHENCDETNSITVYDGDASGPILGLVCRDSEPAFQSSGRFLTFQYPASEVTDTSNFIVKYKQLIPGQCKGPYVDAVSSTEYSILSPMYPTGIANIPLSCRWYVHPATDKDRILLTIESPSTLCSDVNVTIQEIVGRVSDKWCPGTMNKFQYWGKGLQLKVNSKPGQSVLVKYRALEASPCVATFNATTEEQFLTTPNYPDAFPSFTECRWTIQNWDNRNHNTIRVEVVEMDMEKTDGCVEESLRIRDGQFYEQPIIATICSEERTSFYVYGHTGQVIFRSMRASNTRKGVKLKFYLGQAEPCGGNLTANTSIQSIQSPGYPYAYPSSVECVWTIGLQNPSNFLRVEFVVNELEEDVIKCLNDRVDVFDGRTESAYSLGKVCGNSATPVFQGTEDAVTIVFSTDRSGSGKGFKMTYKETEEPVILNRQLDINLKEAVLVSPRYPSGQVRNMNSTWTLKSRYGSNQVLLTFTDVDIGDADDCSNNYIKVLNGDSSSSQSSTMCGRETGVYFSGLLTVVMKTDNIPTTRGFQAKYSLRFENDIPGCSGKPEVLTAYSSFSEIVNTPNYPNTYPNNAECTYVFKVSSDHYYIRVTIVDAIFAGPSDCSQDYIEIFDGNNSTTTSMARICGSTKKTFDSTGTHMLVRFKSDSNLGAKGATISYQAFFIEGSGGPSYLWVIILVSVLGGLVIVGFVVCYIWRKRKRGGSAAI